MHLQRADASYLARLFIKEEDGGYWTLHRMGLNPPGPKAGVVLDPKAEGFIARGAWRVNCPVCGGSQFGDPAVSRFCCCDCGNAAIGSRWLTVSWPANAAAIEGALLARKNPLRMHWYPHESIEHLHAENVEHGVGTIRDVPKDLRRVVQLLVDAHHEVAPVHVIAAGTIVHPASDWHPAKAIRLLEAMGHNFSEDDIRTALMVHGVGR